MRSSQYLLATLREDPSDAEVISHKLMLRAGMIRKTASGIYSWLPTGLKVLRKVENIVREEMVAAGAVELLMPSVQPAELWQESGRWEQYGPELLRFVDRHQRDFCLGPTHEEVITTLARDEIVSYKQLPLNFFQIQTKFRDEIRPRFGVMRGREFLMKDAYSFDLDAEGMAVAYQKMHQAYCNIFDRIGLEYRAVIADSGAIGGSTSHEFHVLADSGEDAIAFSTGSDYAANVEKAASLHPERASGEPEQAVSTLATPGSKSIEQLVDAINVSANQLVKTLIVEGADEDTPLVALCLRGDHELNEIKAAGLSQVATPLQLANADAVKAALGCDTGFVGPSGIDLPVIVDHDAAALLHFVCGANQNDEHLSGVHWERDCDVTAVADLRNVVAGDASPDGKGALDIKRGIEVGHIFQLGTKYSAAMGAKVLDQNGKAVELAMGCYGIGVSRIVAAAIEQNFDDSGIIWPDAIAPFSVAIIPMNMHRSDDVRQAAETLYGKLQDLGVEVLFDDRKERAGVMFTDAELMGVPHRVVISERGLGAGTVEYKARGATDTVDVDKSELISFLKDKLSL